MLLKRLSITNFKNIAEAQLEFSPKINCLLGNNGMGKSNLLDALYYLSFCKSFSGISDLKLIKRGESFLTLRGEYERKGSDEELTLGMAQGRRKTFRRKGKEYSRLSEHIGSFPLVMISPADSNLITGTGEERRRLTDIIIAQSDPVYLDRLIRYNRALQQRNRLLHDRVTDHSLYMAVEIALSQAAAYLHHARTQFTSEFAGIFHRYYAAIAGSGETPELTYISHLNAPGATMESILDNARRHDEAVGYTSVGPHRDDIELNLDGMPVRRTASQGQCKTFTIAMRLAQYDFLHRSTGMRPLLLLDDIFDKLDATRVERIIKIAGDNMFGQIFITDTNRKHLDSIMEMTGHDYRMWTVENGIFTPSAQTFHGHETH